MAIELTQEQTAEIVPSMRRFFRDELEHELSELHAKFLLNFVLKEIAPFAYNRGVGDAEKFFRNKMEDLSATCFEEELGYWKKRKK